MADIRTIVHPGKMISWEEFKASAPPFSMAFDGYVREPTRIDSELPLANFNHHDGVDRLSTRSTCGMLQMYLNMGLMRRFTKDNDIIHAFFNDPDQDSALARWMIHNPERVRHGEPLLNRLIHVEDYLDATGGLYPFPIDSNVLQELAWIFDPYSANLGKVSQMSGDEMTAVMDAVGHRIDQYLMGRGKQQRLDTRYELMHRGPAHTMVREIGLHARTQLFAEGNRFCVFYRGESPKNRHRYSFVKMDPFADVDLPALFDELNRQEGIEPENTDRWGGGNAYGGPPRMTGSQITPGQMNAVLDDLLARRHVRSRCD